MASEIKIPAYRVKIVDQAGQTVHQRDFKHGPGRDQDLLDYRYGPNQWDNIRARLKTHEGNLFITFRNQSSGQNQGVHFECSTRKRAEIRTGQGQLFQVLVETLPEEDWLTGAVVKFKPPRATITGEANGWRVTFMPQQYPCVLTVAVAAAGTKDENLPSFPFPSNPRFAQASYLLAQGQFAAAEGGVVRLGVRGAGLQARVKLPAVGVTVEIEEKHFKLEGAGDPRLMQEAYVLQKYNEKAGLLAYA